MSSSKRAASAIYEVAVVGGGIVGLATARELMLRGAKRVVVLEAEKELAQHQSGRNSGVIHAGLYYRPGSLKAKLCLEGLHRSYEYLKARGIPYQKNGKLIVAVHEREIPSLQKLYQNALVNQVPRISYLDKLSDIQRVEPECVGLAAIHSPETGVVDWGLVAQHYGEDIVSFGGEIRLNSRVIGLEQASNLTITLEGNDKVQAERVITCTGVQSDRVARLLGGAQQPHIVPVRGEFLRVTNKEIADRIRGSIYPVRDLSGAPFLGVHFTRTASNEVIVGPNAVVPFSRTGYDKLDVSLRDMRDMLSYAGFWRLAAKYPSFAARQMMQSAFIGVAARQAIKYVPSLAVSDFERRGSERSGIRAQAVDVEGNLLDDFIFEESANGCVLHTRNAPSPGATSSLAIGRAIVDRSGWVGHSEDKDVYAESAM